jgi:peptidoglycan hydrolase-like protein with peptidoglycan-binding domain
MRKSAQKFVLGFASVLAFGIGGAAPDYAADAGNPVNAGDTTVFFQTLGSNWGSENLRKDDIRWAQVELRNRGLYKGSLDGILGPDTKRALILFQSKNGLGQTAALDEQTWEELTRDRGVAQGSSIPPSDVGAGAITTWSGAGK